MDGLRAPVERHWIICPFIDCLDYTLNALTDCLAQDIGDVRVLLVNNGSSDEVRDRSERRALEESRIFVWSHVPPLPSLSATWNTALKFVWSTGATHAMVVNNDVRLHASTYRLLLSTLRSTEAYFVSAVGVTEAQYDPTQSVMVPLIRDGDSYRPQHPGGPDFSCYVVSEVGHIHYPFDEGFVPAYCEDLDLHRRYMLGGDSDRIFSVNVPYLHFASRTINRSPDALAAFHQRSGQSRAYYLRKWGGNCNEERYTTPFDPGSAQDGVTTPDLQRAYQRGEDATLLPTPSPSPAAAEE